MSGELIRPVIVERAERAEREPGPDDLPKVGEWYWVKLDADDDYTKDGIIHRDGSGAEVPAWFGCVTHVGSNYAELKGLTRASEINARVHFDDFAATCTREYEPQDVLDAHVEGHKDNVRVLMGEISELTARLGCSPRQALDAGAPQTEALVLHSTGPIEDYKKALVLAKETTLPDLFRAIKRENEALSRWMQATMIPLEADVDVLEGSLGLIKNRIFSVELYAGLTENVGKIRDGAPAAEDTPVHLMQRRCYMDEECLARYEAGGMTFKDVHGFDEWLARPENMERLLPHPRCIVAFRVRRHSADRHFDGSLAAFFRIQAEEDADKKTFLYLRNGDQLYWLETTIEFGEKLFPDLDRQQLTQALYDGRTLVTEGEYREMQRAAVEARARLKTLPRLKGPTPKFWDGMAERKRHPIEADYEAAQERWQAVWDACRARDNERGACETAIRAPQGYKLVEPNYLYYDDVCKNVADQMAEHNRVVLVVQGLLDRSPVFHPHPPWKIFTDEGFRAGIRLTFDEDRALTAGEAPDFEAYRNALNGSLRTSSIVIGQEDAWERHEGEKESARRAASWRYKSYESHVERHRPFGDPGPGLIAPIARWSPGTRTALFKWTRKRQTRARWPDSGNYGDPMPRSFSCSADELFNVDAYEPGDYRIFFDDPRTRAEYLKWAHLLLRAEDYKAGKSRENT